MESARIGAIDWDEFFMGAASLASQRSKDPVKQVGAVIVNKYNRILSTGYNGMPAGFENAPWGKGNQDILANKQTYVVHAESNAICNWYNRVTNAGYKIYVTLYPCNECAKLIIQSGIKEVIYANEPKNWKDNYVASQHMFMSVGIKTRKYKGRREMNINI